MGEQIDLKDYQKFCKTVPKPAPTPVEEIMTWGLGISGEAGDAASCAKKHSHKNDQKQGTKESLGDTMWYIAMICNFYGWGLNDE